MPDLRNAATTQEAYFEDNGVYANSIDKLIGSQYGLYLSEGVEIRILSADENQYVMVGFHKRRKWFWQIKGPGGTIEKVEKSKILSKLEQIDEE